MLLASSPLSRLALLRGIQYEHLATQGHVERVPPYLPTPLGDLAWAAVAAGVADSLSERTGGQLYRGIRAAVDAVAASSKAELGLRRPPCGKRNTAGRSDQIVAALELDTQSGSLAAPDGPILTKREHQISRLICAGLINREIGEQLNIVQRSLDTHVGHILPKLGCTNRAQVTPLTSIRSRAVPDI